MKLTRRGEFLVMLCVAILLGLFLMMSALILAGPASARPTPKGGPSWHPSILPSTPSASQPSRSYSHSPSPSTTGSGHLSPSTCPATPTPSPTPTPSTSAPLTPSSSSSSSPTGQTGRVTASTSCMTVLLTFDLTKPVSYRLVDWNHGLSFPEVDITQPAGHSTYTWHLAVAIRQGTTDQVDVWTAGVPTRVVLNVDVPINCDTTPKPSPSPSSGIGTAHPNDECGSAGDQARCRTRSHYYPISQHRITHRRRAHYCFDLFVPRRGNSPREQAR